MRLPFTDPWSPVEARVRVEAPREEVFNALADPATYPTWLVGAQRIRGVDGDFPRPGTHFDHSVGPNGRATIDDDTTVVESQGHRRLVLEVHAGPFTGQVEFDLKKRGEATEVIMRERGTGPASLLTPLLRPALAIRNARSLRNFSRMVGQRAA